MRAAESTDVAYVYSATEHEVEDKRTCTAGTANKEQHTAPHAKFVLRAKVGALCFKAKAAIAQYHETPFLGRLRYIVPKLYQKRWSAICIYHLSSKLHRHSAAAGTGRGKTL